MASTEDDTEAAFDAVDRSDVIGIAKLVASLPDKANTRAQAGRSLLGAAIVARKTPMMLQLLQLGADPNGPTDDDLPALLFAIEAGASGGMGAIDTVELLIQKGADVHVKDRRGRGALHLAADAGPMQLYSAYMSRYLIGAGADVHAKDGRGRTPLHIAVETIAKDRLHLNHTGLFIAPSTSSRCDKSSLTQAVLRFHHAAIEPDSQKVANDRRPLGLERDAS